METKKISFGFMKTKKQEKPETVETKEYIDCVEEKAIKVIGGETIKEDVPLVIPMKPNTLVTAERLKEIAEKVESALDEPVTVKTEEAHDEVPQGNETLDQMAARELLQEAKKEKVVEQPTLMVPLPAKPVVDGEKESTLDDYESVPIQEFGLAMLRGMGWTPGEEKSKYKQPQLRPKGLGLGADKVVTENQKKKATNEKDEELSIVKGSFVKVTAGKYNGCYGKVLSLDEENGRVMIDMAVKNDTVSLSEFMMQAVTKTEYDKQSKVLNAESYTQYKKNESDGSKTSKEQNTTASRESTSNYKSNQVSRRDDTKDRERIKEERYKEKGDKYSNGRNKDKEKAARPRSRDNSSSDEEVSRRNRRKDKKRYSSQDSLGSDSEKKHRRRKKRHSSSSSTDSSEEEHRRKHRSKSSKNSKEKRDIDKKRKGKKKKRDRDRSPNYRKHKK